MITAFCRGHKLVFDEEWKYEDGKPFDDSKDCIKCNKPSTPEGYDPCLGYIEGATSACCGHGVEEPFIVYGEE